MKHFIILILITFFSSKSFSNNIDTLFVNESAPKTKVISTSPFGDFKVLTYYNNGNIKSEINYDEKGFQSGYSILYDSDGRLIYTKQYSGDRLDGKVIYYNKNSVSLEGQYKNGLRDGEWRIYSEDNRLITIVTYKKGKILSRLKWDKEDGLIVSNN